MAKEGLGLEITELRLGLPGGDSSASKKRVFSEIDGGENGSSTERNNKNAVVGWPPVCSYRKKKTSSKMYVKVSMDGAPFLRKIDLAMHKDYSHLAFALDNLFASYGIGQYSFTSWKFIYSYFCVNWYLRILNDLISLIKILTGNFIRKQLHASFYLVTSNTYKMLMFGEKYNGMTDAENCEQVPIYEDKDGDWMLVGDVPWE